MNCLNIDRNDFHIDFNEEEASDSDEEQELSKSKHSVLEPYSLNNLINDEKDWRLRKKNEDSDSYDSYDRFDGIGTNMVNNKQLRKIRMSRKMTKHHKQFYTFPAEDEICTESQLEVLY